MEKKLYKFKELCKEKIDTERLVSQEINNTYYSIVREQKKYGEMYKPKETLSSLLFGKKCPSCGDKLEKTKVFNLGKLYTCKSCDYIYADQYKIIDGGD